MNNDIARVSRAYAIVQRIASAPWRCFASRKAHRRRSRDVALTDGPAPDEKELSKQAIKRPDK